MELYNCKCCSYTTNIKSNLTRHIKGKHTAAAAHNTEDTIALKAEIETLKANHKAEIELLKTKHETDLIKLKLSMYENQQIRPNRKSISPAKPEQELPSVPIVIPKKAHNGNTLDYLNKYFPPLEHNALYDIITEKLSWNDIELSTSNLDQQYISLLRPLIEEYKMVFHSGEKNHSLKFYYINNEYKWVEDLSDMTIMFYYIKTKFDLCMVEKFKINEFNAEEQDDLMVHYGKKININYAVKQLLDIMKLPEN